MESEQATLLIVEDDLDIAEMLKDFFRGQGYRVLTVNWGEDGVRVCQEALPDLIILDIRLPDIDGFEVARRLRANRRTAHLPIIFLTEKRERKDRLTGLALNADDYITKPFDIQELRLRVRNALSRARQTSLTHPVTGMPFHQLVDEQLQYALQNKDRSMLVVSLQKIEPFREVYGFVASDDLLRAVALMIQDTLGASGLQGDFFGHLTHTDFIIITHPAQAAAVREALKRRLTQSFNYFYRDQDRESSVFNGQHLSAEFSEWTFGQSSAKDLEQLKAELAKLYQPKP